MMHTTPPKRLALLACAAALAFLTGCSTFVNSHRQKTPMMNAYLMGNFQDAQIRTDAKIASTRNTGDELVWQLEAGSVALGCAGYDECIRHLERAEELITQNDEKALISLSKAGQEALSVVLNPNVISYVAFNRDRMALPLYKALAYLGKGNEAAFRAQLNRLRAIQNDILEQNDKFIQAQNAQLKKLREENKQAAQRTNLATLPNVLASPRNTEFATQYRTAKAAANNAYATLLNPLSIFLSGLGSIRDGQFGNARIDFKRFYDAMPANPLAQTYCATVHRKALELGQTGQPLPDDLQNVTPFNFPLDRNCVFVLVANGRTAAFRQMAIYYPIQLALPMLEFYTLPFTGLTALSDGITHTAHRITDMDACIAKEYSDRLPGMIIRTATAVIAKEIIVHAAQRAAYEAARKSENGAAIQLGALIGGAIYKIATATADTRTWEALPKEFLLTQFPMPKDRKVRLTLNGPVPFRADVQLPPHAASAIVFVHAPSSPACTIQVLPFTAQ